MRLRHIEIFHAIYTTGSITNAAKILHVSQPSVSKVLAHAEMRLGFNLFERVKGRLVPTDEAELLFDEVDRIYQQIRAIKNTAENIKKSDYGSINLGITPALGFNVAPKAISNFHRQNANVSFNVQTVHNDAVLQTLLEHKCDLAVLFSPADMNGVITHHIATSELVVVYPKAIYPSLPSKLTLSELNDHEFIDIGDSGPLGELFWTRLMAENVQLNFPIKVQTYFIAARLVAQGIGICVIDRFTAEANLTEDTAIASFEPPLTFDINLLHMENKGISKAAEAFIPYLKQEFSTP